MEHIENNNIQQSASTVVTLGNFDGIHLGHQSLINKTRILALENNFKSVVFTFSPHPKLVFNSNNFGLIMSPEEKKKAIESLNIDIYIEYIFNNEFAKTSPQTFFNDILVEKLNCKILIVGEDYHFGAGRQGDFSTLQKLGKQSGIEVIAMPSVMIDEEKVSSTRIRKCLLDTDFKLIEIMLGRPYSVIGEVVQGRQIGRTIGFPTANISAYENKVFPPNGVYATKVLLNGQTYHSITNIGTNPTVNGNKKMVETHLINFNQVVYGEYVEVIFYAFIRPERKFPNIDALKSEIEKNTLQVKEYFKI